MLKSSMAGVLIALALTVTADARAQEFQTFDHGAATIEVASSDQHARSIATSSIGRSETGSGAAQRTFEEALYEPLIRAAEARYALPPRLLQALVWQESRFNPMAVSSAGAAGLAQLMPATARELGVANRLDPGQNIDGGARYLRQMLDRFETIHLALAAYNAGPGAVARAQGIPQNRETPNYVRSVIARWMAYSSL